MFKKRPRVRGSASTGPPAVTYSSKLETGYWQQRLFKNTFTYRGQRREVNGWAVKLQLFGKRKTFSLNSSDRRKAAAEACQIYQTIHTQGWEAVGQRQGRLGFPGLHATTSPDGLVATGFDTEHWRRRLIHRRYLESAQPQSKRELSVRIEHAGLSRYFPLGTHEEPQAAARAQRIHQAVVGEGWAVAKQKFTRELTLALRWLDDPLAWTYTTFHTWTSGDQRRGIVGERSRSTARSVAILEPDAGIRFALAASVDRQEGFQCCATFGSLTEARREITRHKTDLLLTNYALPDRPGSACLEELQQTSPALVGLLYSVFEDSEQLFKATPGGAVGYMLKRTPVHCIFEPLAEAAGRLTPELISVKIREYFQRLVAALPAGPSALDSARLTPREHEILTLLAKGELAKEIADTLGISIWTVHGHVKSIFEKLDVHSRTEAVVKFLQK